MRKSLSQYARVFALSSALAALACGGPTFKNGEYRSDEFSFRLGPFPSGLTVVDSSEATLAFRDDARDATWAISARCNMDSDDIPLRALVEHLFIKFTDRAYLREVEYELDGRAAREVELTASIDGVKRQFLIVVVRKNGCVYDFMHIGLVGEGARAVESRDDFRAMVRGFHVIREK